MSTLESARTSIVSARFAVVSGVAVVAVVAAAFASGCGASATETSASGDQALTADSQEASASSAQASHIDEMLYAPAAGSTPEGAASAVVTSSGWWPEGCATHTRDATNPAVVHVVLRDCTGPFGLVHWNGDITTTFSKGAGGELHAESTSTDLTVNDHPVAWARSADISSSGAIRTIQGHSAWTRVNAKGETVSHAREGTVVIDASTHCRTSNGSETTLIGEREIDSTVRDYKICRDTSGSEGCPSGSWTIVHKASGRTITIEFDGSNMAKVDFPKGSVEVALVCGR